MKVQGESMTQLEPISNIARQIAPGRLVQGRARHLGRTALAATLVGGLVLALANTNSGLWTTPIADILPNQIPLTSDDVRGDAPVNATSTGTQADIPASYDEVAPHAAGVAPTFSGGKAAEGTPVEQTFADLKPIRPSIVLGTSVEAPPQAEIALHSQAGDIVEDAIEAPALQIAFDPALVKRLVAAGKAAIVATSGGVIHYVLQPDGRFAKATTARVGVLSNRAFEINDAVLSDGWSTILMQDDGRRSFSFDLRFSAEAEAEILIEQRTALAGRHVDASTAARVTTLGFFDEALVFHVRDVLRE